ncbi:phospholipid carrier-dependent glycosyltransferase [Halolamina rubra]|uniref:phospholipid carrier-dependent glycosyltransferase n=1 Tax=Halolamina rubra TaxID=1380430 RepID=UPI0009E47908|nr:phospholipid carrier-dependent glycosyltransferase [Halolamina rubra]
MDQYRIFSKLSIVISLTAMSIGIYFMKADMNLYPAVSASIAVISIVMLSLSVYYQIRKLLVFVSGISVGWTYLMFQFPASLIGIDPDWFAWQILRVGESGGIDVIQSEFYSSAPLFIIKGTVYYLISGLEVAPGMMIYPITLGITIPILTYVVAMRVWRDKRVSLIAAILMISEPTTINWAIYPIAQSLALIFVILAILFVVIYETTGDRRMFLLLLLTVVAMVFTHKLPLVYIVTFCGLALLILNSKRVSYKKMVSNLRPVRPTRVLLVFFAAFGDVGFSIHLSHKLSFLHYSN